jgi:hypothetical protein
MDKENVIYNSYGNSQDAPKKNEISSFAGKRMELENTTLSEVSQVQKAKSHTFSLTCGI